MIPIRKMGPGLLVTAAFIGPGTVTTATAAGANFGFALLWTLVFSVFATIVLQEMAARLGLVTRLGLAEAMRTASSSAVMSRISIVLVVASIGLGNAAYEVGNIAGAALAATNVTGIAGSYWSVIIGIGSGLLLAWGRYRVLEGVLIALVLVISSVFIFTAIWLAPDMGAIARGIFIPTIPSGSMLSVIGLVGTTVVPYNLFLHCNAVKQKWSAQYDLKSSLRESRWDTGLAVGLGGLITLAILSTGASTFFKPGLALSSESMGDQLAPVLGDSARYVFAAGLFSGGLTSAITAPLAAAYAVCGAMGWPQDMKALPFKLVWLSVLATGTIFAASQSTPLPAILFAQVANGFLLPFVAIFLLLVMNNKRLLGEHRNGPLSNILGIFVVLTAIGLGGIKLLGVFLSL